MFENPWRQDIDRAAEGEADFPPLRPLDGRDVTAGWWEELRRSKQRVFGSRSLTDRLKLGVNFSARWSPCAVSDGDGCFVESRALPLYPLYNLLGMVLPAALLLAICIWAMIGHFSVRFIILVTCVLSAIVFAKSFQGFCYLLSHTVADHIRYRHDGGTVVVRRWWNGDTETREYPPGALKLVLASVPLSSTGLIPRGAPARNSSR